MLVGVGQRCRASVKFRPETLKREFEVNRGVKCKRQRESEIVVRTAGSFSWKPGSILHNCRCARGSPRVGPLSRVGRATWAMLVCYACARVALGWAEPLTHGPR